MAYLDFTEMAVSHLAAEIVKNVYDLSATLPRSEDDALRGQPREAATGSRGNTAEGFKRFHRKVKASFDRCAGGSSYEVRSHLLAGHKVGYFIFDATSTFDVKCLKVGGEVNKIFTTLAPAPHVSSHENSTT